MADLNGVVQSLCAPTEFPPLIPLGLPVDIVGSALLGMPAGQLGAAWGGLILGAFREAMKRGEAEAFARLAADLSRAPIPPVALGLVDVPLLAGFLSYWPATGPRPVTCGDGDPSTVEGS